MSSTAARAKRRIPTAEPSTTATDDSGMETGKLVALLVAALVLVAVVVLVL